MVAPSIQLTRDARAALRSAAADMLKDLHDGAALNRLVDEVLRVVSGHYHYRAGPVCPSCFLRSHRRSKVVPVLLHHENHTDAEVIRAIRRSTSIRDTALVVDLMLTLCGRGYWVQTGDAVDRSQVRIEALTILAKYPHEKQARAAISSAATFEKNRQVREAAFRLLEQLGMPGAVRSALEQHPGLRRHATREWPWNDDGWTALLRTARWQERDESAGRPRTGLTGLKCATCPNRTLRERLGDDWTTKPEQKQQA